MQRGGKLDSTALIVLISVAVAAFAIVVALVALRSSRQLQKQNAAHSGTPDYKIYPNVPEVQRVQQVPIPDWTVPNPAHPAYHTPPPSYPAVRVAGDRVLDVRVHNASPGPPLHPFALAAGLPFRQVGIVYNLEADKRYPLFAREAPYRKNRYQYYVSSDDSSIQISARAQGRDCGEEIGCEELYTDDTITVPELGGKEYTVKLFAR